MAFIKSVGRKVVNTTLLGSVVGTTLLAGGTAANAAGPSWWDPSGISWEEGMDGTAHGPGKYGVRGILENGRTWAGAYKNFDSNSGGYWAWCIQTGLPVSLSNEHHFNTAAVNEPLSAYAMSMYGDTTNNVTASAVAAIVHRNMDEGTVEAGGRISAEDRQGQWAEAIDRAPQDVKNEINRITGEFQAYQNSDKTPKVTVNLSGNMADGYRVEWTVPGNVKLSSGTENSTITLTGATFPDGSTTKTVGIGESGSSDIKVNNSGQSILPVEGSVKADIKFNGTYSAPGDTIYIYRGDSTSYTGGSYTLGQKMAWSKPKEGTVPGASDSFTFARPSHPFEQYSTTAVDAADSDKIITKGMPSTIKDTLTYSNILMKDPTLGDVKKGRTVATLYNKTTGEEVPGVTATKEWDITATSGKVDVAIDIPADLPDGEYTVFQRVSLKYAGSDKFYPRGGHTDPEDPAQLVTVKTPTAKTTALDKADKDKYISWNGGTLVDTVTYSNLTVGKEYTVEGTLKDKGTGKDLLGEDGKPITSSTKFTPTKPDGTVNLEFKIPAISTGKTVVAFETVKYEGKPVVIHADINDKDQTVYIPKIGTTATDVDGGDKHLDYTADKVTINDRVSYKDLKPDTEYSLRATVMDKATKKPLLDAAGKPVIGVAKFTSSATGTGTTDVKISVDPKLISGKTLVMFESAYADGKEIAIHNDINDEGQTLYVPKIGTTATDAADGDKHLDYTAENSTINDVVKYQGLMPGKKYSMRAVVMDKETKKPLLDSAGNPFSKTVEFTASTTGTGNVSVKVPVEAKAVEGKQLVMFETTLFEGKPVAVHANINDLGQTVYVPKIGTTAFDPIDGDKHVDFQGDKVAVRDDVKYSGLMSNTDYTMKATVMDKATGNPLLGADGKPVVKEVPFKTDATGKGTVSVDIDLDPELVGGKTLVMFEDAIYQGKTVTVHADINDVSQTFYIPKIGTQAWDKADGDKYIFADTLGDGKTVVVDTVKYDGLIPGQKYVMTGWLMTKTDDAAAAEGVEGAEKPGTDVPGGEGTATESPSAPAPGSDVSSEEAPATAQLAPSATKREGYSLIVTASDGKVYTLTADNPTAANFKFVDLGNGVLGVSYTTYQETGGTVETGGGVVAYNADGTINRENTRAASASSDRVEENAPAPLQPADAPEGEAVNPKIVDGGEGLLDKDGKLVEGQVEFVASETGSGEVEMEFILPDTAAGKRLVAFEQVYHNIDGEEGWKPGPEDVPVTVHEDINDEGQTVYVPEIGTKALDKADQDKNIIQKGGTVEDTVKYEGLRPNTEYDLTGTLMDKETGKPLLDENGKEVTQKVKFTSSATGTGTAVVEFKLPDTAAGKTLVAFETVSVEGTDIAVHTDIEDKEQTVYVRDIGTVAADKADGDKMAEAGGVIVDDVKYTNFVPGDTYKLEGFLYNKNTGKFVSETPVTGEFVADKSGSGVAKMEFQLPDDLAEGRYVVYEYAYDSEGELVASHEDPNSQDQMFGVDNPETPNGPRVNTGGEVVDDSGTNGALYGVGAAVVALAGAAALRYRRTFKVNLKK